MTGRVERDHFCDGLQIEMLIWLDRPWSVCVRLADSVAGHVPGNALSVAQNAICAWTVTTSRAPTPRRVVTSAAVCV